MEHKFTFIVKDDEDGTNLKQYLRGKGISAAMIRNLKNVGRVHVNGRLTRLYESVSAGAEVELIIPQESSEGIIPQDIPIEILYEDQDLLIINKPPGLVIHPTFNYPDGTLANGVVHYWQSLGISYKFRPVNRIDRDTSGIVIIALNGFSQHQLFLQQERGTLYKGYQAIVTGFMQQSAGLIDAPIGRKDGSIIQRSVMEKGQTALTKYQLIKAYNEASFVEVQLLTGRTHQIRVHFAHIGHPLLGDDLYGGDQTMINRQALHAHLVCFIHPRTEEAIQVEAPLPSDIKNLLLSLEHKKMTK